jgi:hypothetical protein
VLFDCNDRLRPTLLGWLSAPFKPPTYKEEYEKLPLKYQKIIRTVDIAVLGVLVLAIAYPFIQR